MEATTAYDKQFYGDQWRGFLFMFACTTAHEMTHLFTCYLNQSSRRDSPFELSYLDYFQRSANGDLAGESGRVLEAILFGGATEYYRQQHLEPILGHNQVSRVREGMAWLVSFAYA